MTGAFIAAAVLSRLPIRQVGKKREASPFAVARWRAPIRVARNNSNRRPISSPKYVHIRECTMPERSETVNAVMSFCTWRQRSLNKNKNARQWKRRGGVGQRMVGRKDSNTSGSNERNVLREDRGREKM